MPITLSDPFVFNQAEIESMTIEILPESVDITITVAITDGHGNVLMRQPHQITYAEDVLKGLGLSPRKLFDLADQELISRYAGEASGNVGAKSWSDNIDKDMEKI